MKKKKVLKRCTAIAILVILLWGIIVSVDYWRVMYKFKTPIFTLYHITADDGGSGDYIGLGYSFEIKGNFMYDPHPDDYNSEVIEGVTYAKFRLFEIPIKELRRE